MPKPRIGVLESRTQTGAENLADEVSPQEIMDISEVFETPFDGDAHFTVYQPIGNIKEETWPRLNKPILPRLRSLEVDLAMHLIVLDYDNPGHLPWASAQGVRNFLTALDHVAQKFPLAAEWCCLYTTKHGARLVYWLDEPITPEQYEQKHQWMCQQFNNHGIEIDLTVSDWTRCFRAPFVVRDGTPSWDDEAFRIEFDWSKRISAEDLGNATRQRDSKYAEIEPYRNEKPQDSIRLDVMSEISSQSGNSVMSDWHKAAKRRLRGRECSEVLFGGEVIGHKGERNTKMHSYVGQAISLLYYLEDTTPEHIYALFLEAANRLEPDTDTPDWTDVLWDHICRLWAKEDAKARHEQEVAEEQAQIVEGKLDRLLRGFRAWSTDPRVHGNDGEEVGKFIQRRMIAQCGRSYFPIGDNGRYMGFPLLKEQVIPWIRAHGMDDLIETQTIGDDGVEDRSITSIINQYAYPVREVSGFPQIEGGYITDDERLIISLFRRNPNLTPCHNPDVEEWLMHMFGEEFERVCKWIGYALAFEDGPICALSIKGDPGIGKKMFIQGLAECLESPHYADAEEITGDYQYGLLKSPFLAVNEGWPASRSKHPADSFRRLVGGDGFNGNQKFHAPIKIKNPVRIIFAANNIDVVGFLTSGRDLSPEDREALQVRLMHIDAGDEAAIWLRARGGTRFTGGWIEGDGGRPSDFTVARHFLHLYERRANYGPPDPRLLVEGTANSELMFSMRTQSGRGPLVVEAILKMLNTHAPNQEERGIAIEDGNLYVLASEILDYYRKSMSAGVKGEGLNAKVIGNVLKGLVEKSHDQAFVLSSRSRLQRKRWHQVDPEMLLNAAQRDGWRCSKLEDLVVEREKRAKEIHIEEPVKL